MPNQVLSSVENNFTKGLITEFTGLNFPENAATDTNNCVYTVVGDVVRREGFDYEVNNSTNTVDRTNKAISTYKWNNAGGDGNTQFIVEQIGFQLFFYKSTVATITAPLSTTLSFNVIDISVFLAPGSVIFDQTLECQYTDGNGYLIVYHPNCDPFYCSISASGVITGTRITVKIRDFVGVAVQGQGLTDRLPARTANSLYNLYNQGWVSNPDWSTTSTTTNTVALGSMTFTVGAGLVVTIGDAVTVYAVGTGSVMSGTLTSYSGTTMVLNITVANFAPIAFSNWVIQPTSLSHIATFNTATGGLYPSNADVWWYFKNTSGVFDPATTKNNVTLNLGPAPKGHFVLDAFNQRRTFVSGAPQLEDIVTLKRPRTGCFFQGRVWYTGVDASNPPTSQSIATAWTEDIYFSQIAVDPSQFGNCYQANDPTSETLFGLLPSDGGTIHIPGTGSIYKLFPLQNALLVFAANGVWYITGSAGIGFTAEDYTIVKLSSVRSISSTSFIDVQGLPMFWNEEGIYSVEPAKQGTSLLNSPLHVNPLEVNPLTVGTILSFYSNIPLQSKKYVRGDYNPIDYVVQWTYKSTNEISVTDRYQFDSILNYNNFNKAFFPYSLSTGTTPYIHDIRYVAGPGGVTSPPAGFKYPCSKLAGLTYAFTFAEERDTSFKDWVTSTVGVNYESHFITGYKLHGQGQRRFQLPYIYMYSRSDVPTSYKIQGMWDYAITGDSGRWSVLQTINNWAPNFGVIFRRHKIRGQGLVLQIKVVSTDGMPFDIIGWSSFETQNTGV